MSFSGRFLIGLGGLLAVVVLVLWFVWRTVVKAEDAGRMIFKWIITAIAGGAMIELLFRLHRSGAVGGLIALGAFIVVGLFLGIFWAPHLGAALAKPLASLYDGGDTRPEERPFYAIARAKQKRGNYPDAVIEIRKQLHRFPEDYEGWMFLAEIHGDNLHDNAAAQECIEEILSHEGHAPKNIAFALNRSADWHLKLASDRSAAQLSLEQIIARFPETDLAHAAAQRLAHLTTDQMLADQKERPRLVLKHHDEYIGLRGEVADPRPREEDPAAAATRLLDHLSVHPEDGEAREQLARVYADSFQRIDLAADQIEELVTLPGATHKDIARWLNMLADFHVRLDQSKPAAEAALRRIVQLFPQTAVAAQAETRLAYLETEMLKNKTSQALKLGSYEANVGLNSGS